MNIETLQLFCHVVRLRSFSRGASEGCVTQSAASQAVRQLEEELGVRLLDRSKRPLAVTPEGEKFYRACREMLECFERVRDEIARDKRRIGGTVHVAAIYSVGLHSMGAPMQRFRSMYPEARVRLECLHPEAVVQSVLDDVNDLGVLSYPPRNRALTVLPLREEPMLFVCNLSHRLAGRKWVRFTDLSGEPFVAFDADLAIRKAIDRTLRQKNVRLEVVMEFDSVESIKQAVSIGAGVSILPEPAIQKELAMHTLRAISFEGGALTRPIGLIRRHGKDISPTAARFIEVLKET